MLVNLMGVMLIVWILNLSFSVFIKLQLHDAIYRLRFYSISFIHILTLSNSHNNVASIQKNRGDKLHRVIVALVVSHISKSNKD